MKMLWSLLLPLSASGFVAPAPTSKTLLLRRGAADDDRVVVTGLGVVSAIGNDIDSFWKSLLEGETGIDKLTRLEDPSRFGCQIAAEVNDFEAKEWFDNGKTANANDRYTHMAVAASRMALKDSGLEIAESASGATHPDRVGCVIGTAFGGIGTIEREMERMRERGPKKVSPFTIPSLLANTASGVVGIELNLRALNFGVVSACASGTHAIGEALHALRRGEADVVFAGGSEAAITDLMFAGFGAMKAMSTSYNDNPKKSSRPFDTDRAGFVMGEGAGILVLERADHARRRQAPKIYAELAGYGASCDAHHITSPEPTGDGLARCLEQTLKDGNVKPEEVGYVNAHGTGTKMNDKFETLALKTAFGPDHASSSLKISSTKGATGHTLGAAGGIEAIATVLALHSGTLPPTINLDNPDLPDCDLDYIPFKPVHDTSFRAAVTENLGFGGHNGALVFTRWDE